MVEDCMYCGQDRDPCYDEAQMVRRGGSCAEAAEQRRRTELQRRALERIGQRLLSLSDQELMAIVDGSDPVSGGGYQGGEDGQQSTDGWSR